MEKHELKDYWNLWMAPIYSFWFWHNRKIVILLHLQKLPKIEYDLIVNNLNITWW